MITYLSRLTAERDDLTQAATGLANRAADDDRDLTETEQTSLRGWSERCAEIDRQLTEYNSQAESTRAYARLRSTLETPDPEPARRQASTPDVAAGWGDQFTTSDAFRNYLGMGASGRVEVPSPLIEQRAEITSGGWVGTIPPYAYNGPAYRQSTPLLDVVGKVTTGSNSVEWISWAPNPQTAAGVVVEGALKPEAVMTPSPHTDTLDTYAHWKAITRQALEDIPQIRSIVEGRLRGGILNALEGAVVAAIEGATGVPPSTGDSMLESIRAGVGVVQSNGFGTPNAVLLNPADWAALDFVVMGATVNGPVSAASFWGMRPVASSAIAPGTAWVGDFQAAVTLFSRGTTALYMTDSHADYFIRNMILLLAEIRAVATVPEPLAMAECTFVPPVVTSARTGSTK